RRGAIVFDRLVVAIGRNPAKSELFTLAERLEMIAALVREMSDRVEVRTYEGLTVDYAREVGAVAIVRGLRNVSDLNFEFQLALTNRAVADIETVFIMSGETYGFTSSTLIKQIASASDIDRLHRLLPPLVIDKLKEKKQAHGGRLPWTNVDGLKE